MYGWPISLSEAARRLDVPYHTVGVLVRTHEIETVQVGVSKALGRAAYEKLKRYAAPFARSQGPAVATA